MGHLTVYRMDMTREAWETEKFTSGLGRLPDAREPRTHRAVNGDWSFSMKYPLKGANVEALQQQRLICAEGQLYRINGIEKVDTLEGRVWQVDAEHIIYDLRDCDEITNIETAEFPETENGVTQAAALGLILAGTPFVVGTVDNTETLDHLEVLQQGPFTPLKEQVLAKWGGELWPDNWTVNILSQCGQDRRYPIRRGRNLKGITYKESTKDTVTRLHVSGYGGATFESINDGKDYVDSPNIGKYPHPKHGRVEFEDEDDPSMLLQKAQAHLATVDVPQVNYDIDLLFLKNTEQWKLYAPLEAFDLGDTSVIHHEFFSTDIQARGMEVERDPVKETCTRVVLGNYKEDLYTALADAKRSAEIVSDITKNGRVKTAKLQGDIDTLQNRLVASGAYANAEVLDGQGYLLENTDPESNDYGAMYMGPGIFAIANTNKPDNSWDWKTFGGPNGFVGYYILAHTVRAEQLDADDIFANTAFVEKMVTGLVASNLGQQLVLTSNTGITAIVGDVDALDERMTGAEATLLLMDGEIASIVQSLEDKEDRLYAAEQKITPTAITNTVRNSSAYQSDLAWKPHFFVQNSQPASGMVTGDFWLNTTPSTGKNAISRYTGAAWVPADNTDITLALQTANKISWVIASGTDMASMTLTSKLYELIAANIDLQATSRIMLAVKGVTDPITDQVRALAVGGTQLLNKTLFFDDDAWSFGLPAGAFKALGYAGTSPNTIVINAVNAAQSAYALQDVPANPYTQHTLSCSVIGVYGGAASLRAAEMDAFGTEIASHALNVSTRFVTFTTLATCAKIRVQILAPAGSQIYVEKPKLEKGNKATDHSLSIKDMNSAIAEAMAQITPEQILLWIQQGTSSKIALTALQALIESDNVLIRTLAMSIVRRDANGNIFLAIGDEGIGTSLPISTPLLLSPSVRGVHTGTTTPWNGDPQATIDSLPKHLTRPVTVYVRGGTYYQNLSIADFSGAPLTIRPSNGHTVTIVGNWSCTNNTNKIIIRGESASNRLNLRFLEGTGIYAERNDVEVFYTRETGAERINSLPDVGTTRGIYALTECNVSVHDNIFERMYYCVIGEDGCRINANNNMGGVDGSNDYTSLANLGTALIAYNNTQMIVSGTCPIGYQGPYSSWNGELYANSPTPTGSPGTAPAAPTTVSLKFNLLESGTLKKDNGKTSWGWMGTDMVWQADNNATYDSCIGVFVLGSMQSAIAGRAITAAKLKVQRHTAYGSSDAVIYNLHYHGYASKASVPSGSSTRPVMVDTGVDISLARGEMKTVDLPSGLYALLSNGTIKGFGNLNTGSSMALVALCELEIIVQN